MSVKDFDSRFGITTTQDEEKKRFVNRVSQVFDWFNQSDYQKYNVLFEAVCYHLGENYKEIIRFYSGPIRPTTAPHLTVLCGNDFIKTLRTIVALYQSLGDDPRMQSDISFVVKDALSLSNLNLGVQWTDGVFFPSGEVVLDNELIEGALQSLIDYPNENRDVRIALSNYQAGRLDGVVENCYLAVEGLSRKILNNGKTLLNNKGELLQLLGFSKYWGNMLSALIDYANELRRHAGDDRHNLKPSEVEAFLYLTCLFIRAIVRAHQENNK